MLKRSLKNFLLVFSILLTFFLVWQIWFSGYYLPDGYDYVASGLKTKFINPILRLFTGNDDADFSQDIKKLFMPEKIVINHSGKRCVFRNGHEAFEELYDLGGELVGRILSGEYALKNKETVDLDTYFSLLKGKSMYVDYGKEWDYRLFSSAVSGSQQNQVANDLSIVNGYIISLHDGIMNDVSLYIQDVKSNNIYRYVVEVDKNALETRLKEYVQLQNSAAMPSYSFELNFHKEQTESTSKILFEPLLLLDLIPVEVSQIRMTGSEERNQILYDELADTMLDVFSINNRTMRRYTDLDNARVFVENNATLTLYPNGLLEYQTVQGSRGLDISNNADKSNYDIYTATVNAVDFVAKLCHELPPDFSENLQINTSLVNQAERPNSYRIVFDYVVDGMPVRRQMETGTVPAIVMEIDGGYLTSYRHYIKSYEKYGSGTWQMMPVLNAADSLVNSLYNGEKPLIIEKIACCYIEDADGEIAPKWSSVVDGSEQIME